MDRIDQEDKKRIIALAKCNGLTLPEVAEKANVPFDYLYNYLYKNKEFESVAKERVIMALCSGKDDFYKTAF